MTIFSYKAKNQFGKKVAGNFYAKTIENAKQELLNKKFTIDNLEIYNEHQPFWRRSFGSVNFKEKTIFLKYLSTMLKAGLSILKALQLLAEQTTNKHFTNIILTLNESVGNGQSFSDSLKRFPKIFNELFVSVIAVGEKSGTLVNALEYLQYILYKDYEFRKKIKGAAAYPLAVLVLVVTVSVGLVKFIVPRIVKIFSGFQVELPLMTRILIGTEAFLTKYWWLLIFGTITIVVAGTYLYSRRPIKKIVHALILKMPIIGPVSKLIQVTRVTQITASMLTSGLTVVESLQIAGRTLENLVYRDYILASKSYIESGGELSSYLEKEPNLFPKLTTQMINLGENTGTLDQTLKTIAELNEAEVDDRIKLISSLIGPILLVLMAALVGSVAISIILPIYQLPNLLQNR
jgi:type IV pilus assembly protein PilC